MSTEELLRPRYKVIASYPDSNYTIGNILDRNWCRYENDDEETGNRIWQLSDFPHLFKKLEWWEERKPEEMPEYVKAGIEVYKIDHWFATNGTVSVVDEISGGTRNTMFMMKAIKPATHAEYEHYINQQKQNNDERGTNKG